MAAPWLGEASFRLPFRPQYRRSDNASGYYGGVIWGAKSD